uniref:Uncharacterized protein n=1 Tax=Zea mays TaxID=4577 RepID=A0A804NPY0_MAIZE
MRWPLIPPPHPPLPHRGSASTPPPHLCGALAFVPHTRPRRQHHVGTWISLTPAGSQTPSCPTLVVPADLALARMDADLAHARRLPAPAMPLPRPRTGQLRHRRMLYKSEYKFSTIVQIESISTKEDRESSMHDVCFVDTGRGD